VSHGSPQDGSGDRMSSEEGSAVTCDCKRFVHEQDCPRRPAPPQPMMARPAATLSNDDVLLACYEAELAPWLGQTHCP